LMNGGGVSTRPTLRLPSLLSCMELEPEGDGGGTGATTGAATRAGAATTGAAGATGAVTAATVRDLVLRADDESELEAVGAGGGAELGAAVVGGGAATDPKSSLPEGEVVGDLLFVPDFTTLLAAGSLPPLPPPTPPLAPLPLPLPLPLTEASGEGAKEGSTESFGPMAKIAAAVLA
jgi:hypothetical protein